MERTPERFASDIAQLLSSQDPGQTERRKLSTIVDQCGWKRRSEQRVRQLAELLLSHGVFTSTDIADPDVSLDTWIRLSLTPFASLGQIFRQEIGLAYHLSRYPAVFEGALPEYGRVRVKSGGPGQEATYRIEDGRLRPDLVLDTASGVLLAVELERGDPDHGSATQVVEYVDAVRMSSRREVHGVLVTAVPRTAHLRQTVQKQLKRGRAAGYVLHWLLYDVEVSLVGEQER